MKKTISLFLCVLMLLALCLPVSAAQVSITSTASATQIKRGGTVTLTVSAQSFEQAVTTIGTHPSYDTNVFERATASDISWGSTASGAAMKNFDGTVAALLFTTPTTTTGTLFTFTLKVKDSAPIGTTSITITTNLQNGTYSASDTDTILLTVACASHNWSAWSQTSAPGCTSPGQEKRTCGACGTPETRTVSATGHSFGGWSQTSAPGCTSLGQEKRTCSTCGTPETRPITATGHKWSGWSQSKVPGCTTAGEQKRTCNTCGTPETRAIAATGHKFSNPTVTKAPTCTATGTETGKCSACGQTTSNTLASLGHKYGSWTNDKAATCTAAGSQKRTCSNCGDTATRSLAALGHDFEDPTIVREATIATPGLMEGKCKNCGEATQQTIPCGTTDANTGITVEAEEGVFATDTQTAFSAIADTDTGYEGVKNAVADFGSNFEAYSINFTPAPNGTYTLTLPNTGKLAEEDMTVVLVAADGSATKVEFTLDTDGNIRVSTAETGTFAVIDKNADNAIDTDTDQPPVTDQPDSGKTLWVWIVIGVIVAAAAAVTVLLVLKKEPQE